MHKLNFQLKLKYSGSKIYNLELKIKLKTNVDTTVSILCFRNNVV
jgi:hypothetical protein